MKPPTCCGFSLAALLLLCSHGFCPSSLRSSFRCHNHQERLQTSAAKDPFAAGVSGEEDDDEGFLDYAIDSFLSGNYYAYPMAEDAPRPHPSLGAGETVDVALRALRELNHPHPGHGAAVLLRFCLPLSRAERWGDSGSSNVSRRSRTKRRPDEWKELMRSSLTPAMLAQRLRASNFAALLDWTKLDVTEGTSTGKGSIVGSTPSLAFVNAALYFGKGTEPSLIQFTLKRAAGSGVWIIDSARQSSMDLFLLENRADDEP